MLDYDLPILLNIIGSINVGDTMIPNNKKETFEPLYLYIEDVNFILPPVIEEKESDIYEYDVERGSVSLQIM